MNNKLLFYKVCQDPTLKTTDNKKKMNKIDTKQIIDCRNCHEFHLSHNLYTESLSGCGSNIDMTNDIRKHLPLLFEKFKIKSVIDSPCGDWNWMKLVNLDNIDYIGYDILSDILEFNNNNYKKENINFEYKDIINDSLPSSDLIICRDFMFHIRNEYNIKLLENFKNSGSKFLLSTSFDYILENQDLSDGNDWGYRPINLLLPPYNLGEPLYSFNEEHPDCHGRTLYLWKIN